MAAAKFSCMARSLSDSQVHFHQNRWKNVEHAAFVHSAVDGLQGLACMQIKASMNH